MKITVLDSATLGRDLDLGPLSQLGETEIYKTTLPDEVACRIEESDVVIINKVKLGSHNLRGAKNLKLICIAATGYDNVDIAYCRENGIAVCNVKGYSTNSVSQLTVLMALNLITKLPEYTRSVEDLSYTKSGLQNRLEPVYHEIAGKTWGIVGFGDIGKKVAQVAQALGCRVLVCRRNPHPGDGSTDIDTLCRQSDIISLHTPLNDSTRNLIDKTRINTMKKDVIIINVARGAVTDEAAVAHALKEGKIGGFGCDVYSVEPFPTDHPFCSVMHMDNVCLTPHMAWGAYESRSRCLGEIIENIKTFFAGGIRNRLDLM